MAFLFVVQVPFIPGDEEKKLENNLKNKETDVGKETIETDVVGKDRDESENVKVEESVEEKVNAIENSEIKLDFKDDSQVDNSFSESSKTESCQDKIDDDSGQPKTDIQENNDTSSNDVSEKSQFNPQDSVEPDKTAATPEAEDEVKPDTKADKEEKEDEKVIEGEENSDKAQTMLSPDVLLTPLAPKLPLHELVKQCLKELEVDNCDVREAGKGDIKYCKFSFVQEDSQRCEIILNKLKGIGVGQTAGSSISVFPASVHESSLAEPDTTSADDQDELDTENDDISQKESQFKKSIKSRMVVAQVVASVRSNAMFTFDYLLLLILASIIACLGLVENSSVVLVASMLISPLMGPILAGTFGQVIQNNELRNLGVRSELVGLTLCLLVGFLFGLISGGIGLHGAVWGSTDEWPTSEMKSRGMLRSMWVGVLIALPSGAGVAISVLGGNAGSLVGVAISASLLPPACNAGMLWAYSFLAAISPPDMVQSVLPTVPAVIANITTVVMGNTTANVPIASNMTTATLTTGVPLFTTTPTFAVPESCLPLVDNGYRPVYSCNLSQDAALLGLVSLALTLLNITCIFIMGIVVLRIKEVAPHTAGPSSQSSIDNFWNEDIKVARNYYNTSKGEQSKTLGKEFLEEWKKIKSEKEKTKRRESGEDDELMNDQAQTIDMVNYIVGVEDSPGIKHVLSKLSPATPTQNITAGLSEEYLEAQLKLSMIIAQRPSVYLAEPMIRDKKSVQNAYHTIHDMAPVASRPGMGELKKRFRKMNSLHIESSTLEMVNEAHRTAMELKPLEHNKLFKKRQKHKQNLPKVKFEVTKVNEEEEPLV